MRAVLALLLLALALPGAGVARAEYPDRPIRVVIVFGPGGGADVTLRLMAGPMQQVLGQPVLIENRAGGSGTQGGQVVATAPADGYTLMADASAFVVRPRLHANLGFDYRRDFTPVARLTVMPLLLVVPPDEPARDLGDFIGRLRAGPQPFPYAVAGLGSASHFAGLHFLEKIGVAGEAIAYRGGSPGAMAVVTGETRMNFATAPSAVPLVQAGRLRTMAVSAPQRLALLPEVPPMAETLPGFDLAEWIGFYGPAGLPEPVQARLHAAIRHALAQPEVVRRLAEMGAAPALLTGPDFAGWLDGQRALMGKLVDAAGLKPE